MPPQDDTPPGRGQVRITREALRDGSLLAGVRARALPGLHLRSDAEIEASLDAMLAAHDRAEDVWLFGYGSLIWNPAFHFAERRVATLRGWHRRFCLRIEMGRGSPERPGLMLALDRGGACRGVAFRIAAAEARSELLLVWRREMFGGSYLARWVRVDTGSGPVPAIAFVINRASPRYAGQVSEEETASRLAQASGALGSCAEYLRNTTDHLRELGIRDQRLERLVAAVDRLAPERR